MRIGIDIDDTITKTHEYVYFLKKTYLSDYDSSKMLPDDVFIPFIERFERDIHQNVELKDGVKEALDYLHNNGHTIIILSSRGSYYKNITEDTAYQDTVNYFKRNKLPYDKIFVNLTDKRESCIENKIDLFIDDKESECISVESANIPTIKMERKDDVKTNLKVAKNWQEIMMIIKEMN